MKKNILTVLALVAGATLAHAQGAVTINATTPEVYTNGYAGNTPPGTFGPMTGPGGSYHFEVLDMPQAAWGVLSPGQQAAAYDLLDNPSAINLWTDSGVTGLNSTLHSGGINASVQTAADWVAPTSIAGYNTAPNYDYYTIVGWSTDFGTNWSTVSGEVGNGIYNYASVSSHFGQTGVAYNYPGGSGLPPVNLFGASGTGLAGSGGLPTTDGLTLNTFLPEPTTLALVGLGGLSLLFLRRRKA